MVLLYIYIYYQASNLLNLLREICRLFKNTITVQLRSFL